jgi:uncharacterized membrane protein YphA (DoxX/SURF4 family)
MNQARIFTTARIAIGGILLVSGVGKVLDATSTIELTRYAFTHFGATSPANPHEIVIAVSVLEIVLGTLLLTKKYLHITLRATSLILLGFTALLTFILFDSTTTISSCGCSGAFDVGMSVEMALVRNLVMMGLLGWMLFGQKNEAVVVS